MTGRSRTSFMQLMLNWHDFDFGRGVVIPLLKNVDGNRFTADNYRGITL